MAYAQTNFPSKRVLKADIAARNEEGGGGFIVLHGLMLAETSELLPDSEVFTLEGPHYPKPHTWYATVSRRADGKLVVK